MCAGTSVWRAADGTVGPPWVQWQPGQPGSQGRPPCSSSQSESWCPEATTTSKKSAAACAMPDSSSSAKSGINRNSAASFRGIRRRRAPMGMARIRRERRHGYAEIAPRLELVRARGAWASDARSPARRTDDGRPSPASDHEAPATAPLPWRPFKAHGACPRFDDMRVVDLPRHGASCPGGGALEEGVSQAASMRTRITPCPFERSARRPQPWLRSCTSVP